MNVFVKIIQTVRIMYMTYRCRALKNAINYKIHTLYSYYRMYARIQLLFPTMYIRVGPPSLGRSFNPAELGDISDEDEDDNLFIAPAPPDYQEVVG